ncbi:MAG: hypothetical protein JWR35_3922 [Marmoricola sp.]|nr:hypothetical protein [Marmoricola sp.]
MSDEENQPVEGEENQPDVFPREYVEQLRQEAAEHRKRAEKVDSIRDALRAAVLEKGSGDVLHDPLPWDDAYDDENGLPSADLVRAAAEMLALEKPHLARVRGDAQQGFRGETNEAVDLAGMLRAGA